MRQAGVFFVVVATFKNSLVLLRAGRFGKAEILRQQGSTKFDSHRRAEE